jgi:hypothetical protein
MTEKTAINSNLCACGCGKHCRNRFVHGHHIRLNGHHNWKGGRKITWSGYIRVLKPEHPYCDSQGYVLEHRLVMEKYLGRYLTKEENIHHINENRKDNRIENLQIVSNKEHRILHQKDMSNRICYICKSNETRLTMINRPMWYKYKDGFLCHRCYRRRQHITQVE